MPRTAVLPDVGANVQLAEANAIGALAGDEEERAAGEDTCPTGEDRRHLTPHLWNAGRGQGRQRYAGRILQTTPDRRCQICSNRLSVRLTGPRRAEASDPTAWPNP